VDGVAKVVSVSVDGGVGQHFAVRLKTFIMARCRVERAVKKSFWFAVIAFL
jgi:hypothetical protein